MRAGTGYNRFGNPCRADTVPGNGDCGRCTGHPPGAAAPAAQRAAIGAVVDADHIAQQAPPAPGPDRISAFDYATQVREVTNLARRLGLAIPVFKSPPTVPGSDRSITATEHDGATVHQIRIRLVERAGATTVRDDIVDGTIAANPQLPPRDRSRLRQLLDQATDPSNPRRQAWALNQIDLAATPEKAAS